MSSRNLDLEASAAATPTQDSRQLGVSENSQRSPSSCFVIPGIRSVGRCLCHVWTFIDIQRPIGLWISMIASVIFLFLEPLSYYSYWIDSERHRIIYDNNFLLQMITINAILAAVIVLFCIGTLINDDTASGLTKVLHLVDMAVYIYMIWGKISTFTYLYAIIRLSILFTKATKAKWTKVFFNLLLYMYVAHILGALWYAFALGKKMGCLKFNNEELHCNPGIFEEAIQSGILEERYSFSKFLYCLRWGLQTLSCLGQNLKPSRDWWENIIAIAICISAVALFAFLIGNIQAYLKYETESQRAEPKEWMSYKKLPKELQNEALKYRPYVPGTGVNMENWFKNLPINLQKNIKLELCLELLRKVKEFENLGESTLKYMCNFLKPVSLVEHTFFIRKGDTIFEMLLVVQGKLRIFGGRTTSSRCSNLCIWKNKHLKDGDICGKELVTWVQGDRADSFPISNRSIQVVSNVEAFALLAVDLQNVFAFAEHKAAVLIQSLWRSRRNVQASTQGQRVNRTNVVSTAIGA